jgi:RNA polymerase sigma-70 factor (ECF subfamily)
VPRVTDGSERKYAFITCTLRRHVTMPRPLHHDRRDTITPVTADVLALRARDGEAGAFTALVEHLHPRALRFASQMTGASLADVEDIVQDVWIRTFRALPRYDASRSFESWFFTILANCCRSLRVRLRRWQLRAQPLDDQMQDDAIDPLIATSTRSDVARVHRALATLPAMQRETFLLHHVEGFSYEEIAEITGVGVSACKMRAKRAMDAVRELLREESTNA